MGAAPSRETIEHSLPQPPFYGQRQQIVLIPLLKRFFPSADCPLFVQLYEARCDPAVRYYYYADDGVDGSLATCAPPPCTSPLLPGVQTAQEGSGDIASPLYLTETVGNAPLYCPPVDVFPEVPFTREAMYDAYITQGGEKIVFDTDEEMLTAYRKDPSSVRPLPCAVAFLYHKPGPAGTGNGGPTVVVTGLGEGGAAAGCVLTEEGIRAGEHGALADIPASALSSFPEDCSEVLGCHVKATGFVGDVQWLGGRHTRGEPTTKDYEMQMFLTKSAGDHNRTHVLLTAVYTYAEQWQRACVRCVPHDLRGKQPDLDTPSHVGAESGEGGNRVDPSLFYKPFSQTHEMLVEASRAHGHHLRTSPSAEHASAHDSAAESNTNEEHSSSATTEVVEEHAKTRYWAPPPLTALVLRSRRANVPLLCFLREVRACIANLYLFKVKYYYQQHKGEQRDRESDEAMVTAVAAGGDGAGGSVGRPDLLPPGNMHLWLQDTLTLSTEPQERNAESVLNLHGTDRFVRRLVEYIVSCLLHNLNPLEAFRSQPGRGLATNAASAAPDATTPNGGDATEANAQAKRDGEGLSVSASGEAAATTAAPLVPHSLSLFRLPDEDMLVSTWPPRAAGEAPDATVPDDALVQWRTRHISHHLFWVLSPNLVSRRTATAALLHWVKTQQGPVLWGYHLDEHDREISDPPLETHHSDRSPNIYPSSSLEDYLTTVVIDGVEEELLRTGTVMSLMPVKDDAPAASRVLRVCRLPIEELLLGELRNASKLAREAGPQDPHWVRQGVAAGSVYKGCTLHAPDPAAAGEAEAPATVISNGVELPAVPADADGIVGDGTSCLWRVDLVEELFRVIAVTPQFLKPIRKKHPKKKKLPAKAVVAQGTAPHVFLTNNANTNTVAAVAGGQERAPGEEGMAAQSTADPQSGLHSTMQTAAADRYGGGDREAATPPAPAVLSKNQKKKAKKAAAAAAAAVEGSGEGVAAVASLSDAAVLVAAGGNGKQSSEAPAAAAPTSVESPEAAGSKKAKKTAAAKTTREAPESSPEPAEATPPSRSSAVGPKPPQPLTPPRPPLPAGEIDAAAPPTVAHGRNGYLAQQTPSPPAAPSHAAYGGGHNAAGMWDYEGAGYAAPYGHYSRATAAPPSYGAYPPPPPPPPPAPSAGGPLYTGYEYDQAYGYGAASGAPPPFMERGTGGAGRQTLPGYENYYNYPTDGYQEMGAYGNNNNNYAAGGGNAYYDPGMRAGRTERYDQGGYAPSSPAPASSGAHQSGPPPPPPPQSEFVSLVPPQGMGAGGMSMGEREGASYSPVNAPGSRQVSSSTFQRHVSFGEEVAATHSAAATATAPVGVSSPTRSDRQLYNAPPPLPLSAAAVSTSAATVNPSSSGGFHSDALHAYREPCVTSPSGGGTHLHFQTDNLHSPVTNGSGGVGLPVNHHTRYASSPYQQHVATFEDIGTASCPGAGPAGSAVNVLVRVRHHHRSHSHSESFFSDSTADHASHAHAPHSSNPQVSGSGLEASASGMHPSHSFASMGSASIVFHGGAGAAASVGGAGSHRERAHSGVVIEGGSASPGEHSAHGHPHSRPHVPGAASSTRSGETTSTARRMDKRSGTYRWDWRTAGLDMGEED